MTIKRVWHGWADPANADLYQEILTTLVISDIESKNLVGLRKMEVLRFDHDDEVEFVTMMTFDSLEQVVQLQGDDYRKCYVPDAAKAVLSRWQDEATHFSLVETRIFDH